MVTWLSFALSPALAAEPNLLMVGNSYTSRNNLARALSTLMVQDVPGYSDVNSAAITRGGYLLSQHLADADGSRGDTALRAALVTGGTTWDTVVLQEQSQTAGFPQNSGAWMDSHNAAMGLDEFIAQNGAQTVFYMTWGRRDGDAQNPSIYPDYNTMQDALAEGYLTYANDASTAQRPVYVAPAGYAFRTVWNDVSDAGGDPTHPDSDFYTLYSADGSHPSLRGTYLIAATMLATLTGREATSLAGYVDQGLAVDAQAALADVAKRTVLDDPLGELPYPWVFHWDDWDGPISGDTLRPLVWLDGAAETERMEVGSAGNAGRFWLQDGASLTVGELRVGADGVGEVEQRGDVIAASILIGPDGHWTFEQGTIQVAHWTGDLTVPIDGTLVLEGLTEVTGTATIDGVLSFSGAIDAGPVEVLAAQRIVWEQAVLDLPVGASGQLERRDGRDVLVVSGDTGQTTDNPSLISDEGGCGCRTTSPMGPWWALLLLMGRRRR